MSFDVTSYIMGKQAGGGGGGVTVEPLSVTANGVYTAPAGKAYSPVSVEVPGATRIETTFTSASDTNSITIPIPATGTPERVDIVSSVSGSDATDFPEGSVVSISLAPFSDADYQAKVSGNAGYIGRFVGATAFYNSSLNQRDSNATLANGQYRFTSNGLEIKTRADLKFMAGETFNISWLFA